MNARFLLPLTALVLTGAAAPSGIGGSGPIDIQVQSANGVLAGAVDGCNYSITGGARISQGSVRLQARNLTIRGRADGQCPSHVEGTGDVFYVRPDITVKADRAAYDAAAGTVVFTSESQGGVILVRGRNVSSMPRLTLNTKTQEFNAEGMVRLIYYPEDAYEAAGAGWTLSTSAASLSFTRTAGAPVDVANPGLIDNGGVLSWTTPTLRLTLTPGSCSTGGRTFAYTAQVQAGSSSYSGCGGQKSGGA